MFQTISIIGVGLIGGSIGLAARQKRLAKTIIGCGRGQKNLNVAVKRKIIHQATTDIKAAISQADLIVLATPVRTIEKQLRLIARYAKPGTLVTDAGSTKKEIVRLADKILPSSIYFVGAHPVAGNEKSGASAAMKDLFKDKLCIVTPSANTSKPAMAKVKKFWQKIGMKIWSMPPAQHDDYLAATSHLPHMAAFTLMNTLAKLLPQKDINRLAAGGLKDTTRIAASDATMWTDIALDNQKPLLRALRTYQKQITKLIGHLEKKQASALARFFDQAGQRRAGF